MVSLMKRIIIILFFVILLCGCKAKRLECSYEEGNLYKAFAYSTISMEIEEVYVEYELNDYDDVFNLYTIHQNHLPLNFVSMGNANIGLIASSVENDIVYYEVDIYINLVDNLEIFTNLLRKSNEELGYIDTIIMYDNEVLY